MSSKGSKSRLDDAYMKLQSTNLPYSKEILVQENSQEADEQFLRKSMVTPEITSGPQL